MTQQNKLNLEKPAENGLKKMQNQNQVAVEKVFLI